MTGLSISIPQTWHRVRVSGDRAAEVERLAREVTGRLPRDSAAAARRRVSEAIEGIIDQAAETEGVDPTLIAFPGDRGVSKALPVTLTVGTLPAPDPQASVAQVMMALAQQSETATPLSVGDTMAIRTHTLVSVGEQLADALSEFAPPAPGDRAGMPPMASLRARYVVGWQGEAPSWHFVVGTALVPDRADAGPLVDDYLSLFDTMVSTLSRDQEGSSA